MTRFNRRVAALPPESGVLFDLVLGPTAGELTVDQLELAWRAYGEELMADWPPGRRRPWGFWAFEVGEEAPAPGGESVRLAELGLLTDEDLAVIAGRANEARLRVGTGAERFEALSGKSMEREIVERYEAVKAALEERRA